MAANGKYEFDPEQLTQAFTHFNNSLANCNVTYRQLIGLRTSLMEKGWKGNSSQDFYNRMAQYVEQIEKLRDHLSNIVDNLQNAANTRNEVIDAANQMEG